MTFARSVATLMTCIVATGCIGEDHLENKPTDLSDSGKFAKGVIPKESVQFVDIAVSSGLDFRHTSGMSPYKYFPETAGGGGMFWDYDNDGFLDIYLVNSGWIAVEDRKEKVSNALFHNTDGQQFENIAAHIGVDHDGYGMGCSAGDYDNDGDSDLFITNFGPNVLYRNELQNESQIGAGNVNTEPKLFTDISVEYAVADTRWSTGSAFSDYDRDGDLDLYVANYVDYVPRRDFDTKTPYLPTQDVEDYQGDIRAYPHPGAFNGSADVMYRNNGESGFQDVTKSSGLYTNKGKGLGVIFGDCNEDGWPDLYIANDLVRNFFYVNNGDGTFKENALISGTSFGQDGQIEAGMGTDFGDYDNDGDLDITVTNFQKEPNTLYRNEGNGFFANETYASGIGLISLPPLGFGTGFFDFDNDGLQDLFFANGHVLDNVELFDQSTSYAQANQLLRNRGGNKYGKFTFEDVSAASGPGMQLVQPSRGNAMGDVDNDGDVDILVINLGEEVVLLRNDGGNSNNWLSVKTEGVVSNRNGIGARIRIISGNLKQTKEVRGSRGYLSQSDLRVHFGLGEHTIADSIGIAWPSGTVDLLTNTLANRFITVREGEKRRSEIE